MDYNFCYAVPEVLESERVKIVPFDVRFSFKTIASVPDLASSLPSTQTPSWKSQKNPLPSSNGSPWALSRRLKNLWRSFTKPGSIPTPVAFS